MSSKDILDKPGSLLVSEIEDQNITVLDVLLFRNLRMTVNTVGLCMENIEK